MIRIADVIPNVSTMHKKGVETEWKSTHKLFENKKILLVGVPGPFLVEYAATHMRT